MKSKYFKTLLAITLILPMVSFAEENEEHHSVGIRKPGKETETKEGSSGFFAKTYPEVYFPDGMHSFVAVSGFGNAVVIEDGSHFDVSPFDRPKVASFRSHDPILITQNNSWFSSYDYRIINQSTGAILEVNLSVGPTVNGIYTRYIIAIDPYRGEIFLNDSTRWQVSSYDMERFYGWAVNDPVIIGYNSSGWDQGCSGILINVPMNQNIRVAPF